MNMPNAKLSEPRSGEQALAVLWIERKNGREKWRGAARGSLLRLVRQEDESHKKECGNRRQVQSDRLSSLQIKIIERRPEFQSRGCFSIFPE
jgi:hypothetical protein